MVRSFTRRFQYGKRVPKLFVLYHLLVCFLINEYHCHNHFSFCSQLLVFHLLVFFRIISSQATILFRALAIGIASSAFHYNRKKVTINKVLLCTVPGPLKNLLLPLPFLSHLLIIPSTTVISNNVSSNFFLNTYITLLLN